MKHAFVMIIELEVPDHGKQVIVRPLLRKIIRDMGLTVEAYNRLADEL